MTLQQSSKRTPQRPENRPGLSQLAYRIGDYASVRERLLAQLPQTVNFLLPEASSASLSDLTTRSNTDFAIALLDAWSVVADVLTFYQERIANEGYLLTATERRSVLALARSIGYELDPGVAASTYLSFTVEDAPDSPTVVNVPLGTQVMSVPIKDELPQTFETVEELTAHLAWNAISPRATRPQVIDENTQQLYLTGTSTQLTKDDLLLVVDKVAKDTPYVLMLSEVEEDTEADQTIVRWQRSLPAIETVLQQPQVFVFRQAAHLFGYNAPDWERMPTETKLAAVEKRSGGAIQGGIFGSKDNGEAWRTASKGLPNSDILCLVARGQTLFAGTPDKGVFRSEDGGLTWSAANEGVTSQNVLALHMAVEESEFQGAVFAGTPNGGVFRSKDGGNNWAAINTGTVRVEEQGEDNWQSIDTSLPRTIVRSLLTYSTQSNLGTGTISSEGNIVRGSGTAFVSEVRPGETITVNGQSSSVDSVDSDTSLTLDRTFRTESLPSGTRFSATVTVNYRIGNVPVPANRLTVESGSISSTGNQVRGAGTAFRRLTDFVQGIRALASVSNVTFSITITSVGQTLTVNRVDSDTRLVTNGSFSRNYLDAGTSFSLQRSRFKSFILVGTDEGVYRSQDQGDNWLSRNLTEHIIYALYHVSDSIVLAGAGIGVFRSTNDGEAWEPNTFSEEATVFCFVGYEATPTKLFAGTSAGVWRSTDQGASWDNLSNDALSESTVTALETYIRGGTRYLFAASDQGVWVSQNSDQANVVWTLVNGALVAQLVTVLAYSESTQSLFAGTEFKGFLATDVSESAEPQVDPQPPKPEWPEFAICSLRHLDLDTLYPQVLPKSWMVLFRDRHPKNPEQEVDPKVSAHQIDDIAAVDRSDFGLSGKITRAALATDIAEPESFGLRSTVALVQSEALTLAPEPLTVIDRQQEILADPISDNTLYLSELVPFLQPEQTVIVSGQHMRARLADVGGLLRAEYDWMPRHQSLRSRVINTLSASGRSLQFVGTDEGLYRWDESTEPNEAKWSPVSALDYKVIRAIWQESAESDSFESTLLVGADQQLYRSSDNGFTWQIVSDRQGSGLPETVIQTILSYSVKSEDVAPTITAISGLTLELTAAADNLEEHDVITVSDQVRVIVATENNNQTLKIDAVFDPALPLETTPGSGNVSIEKGGKLVFAGTERGLYRSTDKGQTWRYLSDLRTVGINDLSVVVDKKKYTLFAASDQGLQRSTDKGEHWESVTTVPNRALTLFPHELSKAEPGSRLWVGTDKGLYFSDDGGENGQWSQGLRDRQILSLTHNSTKAVLFAGCDQGVYRSRDNGNTWESIDAGLAAVSGRSLVTLSNPSATEVIVGTEQGIFASLNDGQRRDPMRWVRSNTGLDNSQILSLAVSDSGTEVMAGTTAGAFYSTDGGQRWKNLSDGLTPVTRAEALPIVCLLAKIKTAQDTCWYAGTPEGLYCWSPTDSATLGEQPQWRGLHSGLAYTNILTLYPLASALLVGTREGGLLRFDLDNQRWSPTALNNTDVQTLAIEEKFWYAGTLREGLYRSVNSGRSWQQITQVRSGRGTLASDDVQVTWTSDRLDGLLKAGDVINANGQSRSVLRSPTPSPNNGTQQQFTIDQPFKPDLEPNTSFTINTGLTNRHIMALVVVPDPNANKTAQALEKEDLILYAGTAGSGVFRSRDGGDRWTQIITNLEDLEIRTLMLEDAQTLWAGTAQKGLFRSINAGDLWAPVNTHLTNTDIRALIPALKSPQDQSAFNQSAILAGGIGILISDDQLTTTPVQRNDTVQIIRPSETIAVKEDAQSDEITTYTNTTYTNWVVRDKFGNQGDLQTPVAQPLPLLPAEPEDIPVSEIATIQAPPTNQKQPVLRLQEKLTYSYDPATVAIHANVAEATHGETVEEVLGSGDGNEIHQQFALTKPPLTYVSAATASGSQNTLAVRIEGVLWEEASSLYPLAPRDQRYVIRIENDGSAFVGFGDGLRGTRLPSGEENVTATYRSGIGLDGNVAARQLNILKTRPQGITDVINPLPATGAADPERLEDARTKAPPTVRTLDRIVSLQDFEDFAQGFVGIGKAQATALWNGVTQLVHITLAGIQGAAVPETSQLYRQLVRAIDRARDPIQQVLLSTYERQLFNVEARLLIDSRYESEVVLLAVETALEKRFQFDTQAFAQAITAAEVIAAIQAVEGVMAVDLDALYRVRESKELAATLRAQPARYRAQTMTVTPAQLLLLNKTGIQLSGVETL